MRFLLSVLFWRKFSRRGFSLVEILIGAALLLLMFGGIIGAFRSAIVMVGHARASAGAIGLANERIEYVRSLPYDSVGTTAGIPAGSIPQNETVTLNGVTYNRRTLIQYVDAPEDGTGVSDTNGITADYKRAKVEMTWTIRGSSRSLSLVTNVIPKGIETTAGGGTLVVNVFDATAAPIDNATVRVVNASTSPAIDVTSYSNAAGVVMFPGAPAAGKYQVSATMSGYSTDQTYSASSSNPNPNPAHVAVVVSGVSTVNFAIDRTSTRILQTVGVPTVGHTQDLLNDGTYIMSSSTVVLGSGELVLAGAPGSYVAQGIASTTSIAPSNIVSWTQVSWTGSVPLQTNMALHVYAVDAGGIYTRIPNAVLPGNGVGFVTSPINLSGLSASTYPRLALGIVLQSFDATGTPRLSDWDVSYMVSGSPIPSIHVLVFGNKNIGTDAGGVPVKKYSKTLVTNATGTVAATNLEWDRYSTSINGAAEGYDVSDVCLASSLFVAPNTYATTTLVLSPHTTNSLLAGVFTATGNPIGGATVVAASGGASTTKQTSSCGYAFFPSLSATSYTVTASASGYTTDVLPGISVSGATPLTTTLVP